MRELTGRKRQVAVVDGITAQSLNDHYAAISTDSQYSIPVRKPLTTPITDNHVTDWEIFKLLDKLRPTATGLDNPCMVSTHSCTCVMQTFFTIV